MLSQRKFAVLLIAISQTLAWAAFYYIFPAMLVYWESAYGWSKLLLTAVFSISLVAAALFSPLYGMLIDRGSGPLVFLSSLSIGGIALICLPFAETIAPFLILWVIIGFAMGGCLYEPCFAFLIRTLGDQAKRSITNVTIVAGFAGTLSFPISHIISSKIGWDGAVLFWGSLSLFVSGPMFFFGSHILEKNWRPENGEMESSKNITDGFYILQNSSFWMIAIAFSLIFLNHGVIISHLIPILSDRGLNITEAIFFVSLIGPMQVIGRVILNTLLSKLSNFTLCCICFSGILFGTTSLLFEPTNKTILCIFVFLQGSSYGIASIIRPIITKQILGLANFGVISGLIAVPILMSMAFAPFFGSLIWYYYNYQTLLIVLVSLTLIGFYLMVMTYNDYEQAK